MTTTAEARTAANDVADAGRAFAASIGGTLTAWLSAAVVAPAARALARAAADRKAAGAVAEVAADAQGVADELAPELAAVEARLETSVLDGLIRGLVAGWRAGAREQDSLLPDAVRLGADRQPDEAIAAALDGWPIVGHPAAAIAAHHAATWRFQAGAAVGAAVATGDGAAVPAGLVEVARQAGNRAEAAVAEAFQAGVGAARVAAGEALRRALA